jgi:hypothetical protein
MRVAPGLLLCALLSSTAAAQWPGDQVIPEVTYPTLPRQGATVSAFVPRGWRLEAQASGDLNRDRRADAAMVLRMDSERNRIAPSWNPNSRYDTNPRMLVVAFARAGGGYELALVDHSLIPRLENPNQDDPFDEVKIVGGTLQARMHLFLSAGGWRMGGSAYTFRWQDGGFKLIGFDRDAVMRNTGETEEISINYLTGRKLLKTGNIGTDEQRSRSLVMPRKPLLDLAQIGDGLMFDPDEH